MKTLFIIQIRHPNLGKEWPQRDWHDRPESRKDLSLPLAIKKAKRLQTDSERCEYRVIKRVEESIFTANDQGEARR
jgi:hypothetical protein